MPIKRFISGIVVKGKQVGRTIGFPTANLSLLTSDVHHIYGVYGVVASINGAEYYGVMNIGIKPTFKESKNVSYEIYFFDFDQDIYGLHLDVEVRLFVREEIRFQNITQLIEQISKDVSYVKDCFGLNNKNKPKSGNSYASEIR